MSTVGTEGKQITHMMKSSGMLTAHQNVKIKKSALKV